MNTNAVALIITSLALCFAMVGTVYFIKKRIEEPFDTWIPLIIFMVLVTIAFALMWMVLLTRLI